MKIIAHRGASGRYPENSLLAFEKAIEQGCYGIELDVHYHHSGEFILLHNTHLIDENQQPINFDTVPVEQLSNYDVGQGQKVITLSQALHFINARCLVNIEIKSSYIQHFQINSIVEKLISSIIKDVNTTNWKISQLLFSSFNHHFLSKIKQQNPKFKTAALIASCPLDYCQFADVLAIENIHMCLGSLNKKFVEDAHKRGLEVWVYTVNHLDDVNYCKQLSVDGIFTDYPGEFTKD